MWYGFKPYVPVAKRRAQAAREVEKRRKKGQAVAPVTIEGRTIARTFWGSAWCDNLESYSDYANRLPRGRTYVRNGSVVDLQIAPGKVTALVSGSSLYKVTVAITAVRDAHWHGVKSRCAGQIGSLVELLQGRLSKGVMDVVTARDGGLFPGPREIALSCSCPDGANMCKHVAAVLYGVGARLDQQPELLFLLRKVDHLQLIEEAVPRATRKLASGKKTLAAGDLAGVFGIELAEPQAVDALPTKAAKRGKAPATKRVADALPARRNVRKATPTAEAGAAIPEDSSGARRPRKSTQRG